MSKKRKRSVPLEQALLAEAGAIRKKFVAEEPPLQTEKERQAECVMRGIQCVIETLIMKGVDLSVIESSLLYWLVSFIAWNRDASDKQLESLTADMHQVAEKLVAAMKALANEIDDDGPTLAMAAIGNKLDQVKALLGKPEQLSLPEVEQQTEITMRCLHVFYENCRENLFDGMLIETCLFYYWLRTSTINAAVPEAFFQKIERNWEEAVKRKNAVADQLARRR